jgi:hypothetical protein
MRSGNEGKGDAGMNGQIPNAYKKKPHRNWKLTGKAFYERNGRVTESEVMPTKPKDDSEIQRRIKYGY